MRALASLAMRSRSNAIMIATVSAMLAVIVPPLAYFGSATVGLVTLRSGPRDALWVIVGAFVALTALCVLILQNPLPAFVFVLGLWLPLWLVAWLLRETVSLALALEAAAGLGLIVLLGVYATLGDPSEVSRGLVESGVVPALEQTGIEPGSPEMEAFLDQMAWALNFAFVAGFSCNVMLGLLLARWWQAQLYNPGGMRREFHALRLHPQLAPAAVLVVLLAWLGPGAVGQFMADVSLGLIVLFMLYGLAVVHGLIGLSGASVGWLVGLYVLMAIALPHVAVLLALLALLDSGLDLRARLPRSGT